MPRTLTRITALTAAALLAVLASAGSTSAAAAATPSAEAAVGLTVVTRSPHGLVFRTERVAASQARGRALRWRQSAGVVAADLDHRIQVSADPLQSEQWGLTALRADEVQAAGDASGQVIAVIDSGVDASHPDLAGVVLSGSDLVDGGDGRTDPNGHGTHVAGIAAALAGNGVGGAGLAKGARVLPVRVIGADGSGTDSAAARGLVWAADHGATVANLSFGGPERSSVMDAAVRYALGKGVSVVAAAGNEGLAGDPVMWPAANSGVVAVAAVDRSGLRPGWSGTGSHLALSAPGVGILSTVPGGGYSTWSGTSMATPFVAGAVALLQRAQPGLDPAGVRARLTSTADDLGPAGFDPQYGYGMLNLAAAEGLPPAPTTTSTPEPVAADPAPAPATFEPAPSAPVTAEPVPSPVAAEPVPSPAADPMVSPAPATLLVPAPVAAVAPPVVAVRISVSRTLVSYRGLVTVSTRTMAANAVAPDVPVRLERFVGGVWTTIRTGRTAADGLIGWQIRPDRTSSYRVRAGSLLSPVKQIAVRPPA